MKKVIVVGAGIGGLATSVRLALKGYKVHVFEGNHFPGGKLSTLKIVDIDLMQDHHYLQCLIL